MSTKLLFIFLKVFTFGAFLTNSGNFFHTGGTLLENEKFLMLIQLWIQHGWKMAAFQKTFYMVNLQQGKNQQDDPNYVSRTYASETSRHLA